MWGLVPKSDARQREVQIEINFKAEKAMVGGKRDAHGCMGYPMFEYSNRRNGTHMWWGASLRKSFRCQKTRCYLLWGLMLADESPRSSVVKMAPAVGLEPTTQRLTAACSAN